MRKIGKDTGASDEGGDRGSGYTWFNSHRCALILGVIVIVAFLLRFVFAYSVSADGDFALSGGTTAQYHLHVIESILNGTYSLTDSSVNYPIGGSLYIPPIMDFLAAGVATIVQGGMSTTEAASLAVGLLNPIFGALLCIPVFLIAKELYDKTTGLVAALVVAFLSMPISTSVFSSGNEYALAALLLAFMAYFAVRMMKVIDSEEPSRKDMLMNAGLAGVFLALAALTWNGFRFAIVLLAIAMILQAIVSRLRGKDFTDVTLGYTVMILLGTLVPAVYYVPAGLIDAVYSGPLMIAIVSVVFVYAFMFLKDRPWITTIPALAVVFLVFCAILAIAAPDVFNDFIYGNSVYSTKLMDDIVSNHVSMSNVAAYYGWLTMWLPLCLAFYETYIYLRKNRSSTQLFMLIWLYVMFFSVWSSSATAAVVGSVFGVGSAAVIVGMIRKASVRDWASDVKVAGFPGCFRKLIKPYPFVTVLVVALLVVVPNFTFAVDAGQPSNTEGDHFYTGNTSFTIKAGDSYPMEKVWDSYKNVNKDGALVTWIDYSYDAVTQGKFQSVTDTIGGGATAAANMYLADGADGAVAAMIIRIMMTNSDVDYSSCFSGNSSVYSTIKAYIDHPSQAIDYIKANPDDFGKVRVDMDDENAVYLASIEAITTAMNAKEIMSAYDSICSRAGDKIGYVLMDGGMLPLQYNDGNSFSTIAYFADYKVDSYGAATEYFSYNTYYGTTTYTDAMYETLLWKAIIGPSATEAGYSSSYSYLVALSASDGSSDSVKAIPGYGLAGFKVTSWRVMYNEDDEATTSSDGWYYMDGWEAMKKQETDGGMINYLYGIVMLEYVGSGNSTVYSGNVMSGSQGVSGATIAIYEYSDTYDKYVLYSSTKTKSDGSYDALVPSGTYRVDVKIGDLTLSSFSSTSPSKTVTLETSVVNGSVKVNDALYTAENMTLEIKSDSETNTVNVTNGTFTFSGILPGSYSYTLYGATGTSLGTGDLTVYPGTSEGFVITPTTYTITATVNDIYGTAIDGTSYDTTPIVIATNVSTLAQFTMEVGEDGTAVVTVIPGTYSMSLGHGLVTITSTTQAATSSNKTVTLTAYESQTVRISNAPSSSITISAGQFSTTAYEYSTGVYEFEVPVGLATDAMYYSIYAVDGSTVYYGLYEGGSQITLTTASAVTLKGQMKNGDKGTQGTVMFIINGTQLPVATDDEGNFSAILPSGSFSYYANNGSDMVAFGTGSTGSELAISLVDGRKVTSYLRYDPATSESDKALPFVKGMITFTYNDVQYTLITMTNTSGVATYYIPDNVAANIYFNNLSGTLDNDAFSCTKLTREISSSASSTTNTTTIQYVGYETDQNNIVKKISYTAPYTMKLKFYETLKEGDQEFTISKGATRELSPGQYEVTIDGSEGGYFSSTAYLYPTHTDFTGLSIEEVVTVAITKNQADSVTITSDGAYHSYTGGYYFQKGYKYYLESTRTDSSGTKYIQYGYLDLTESASTTTIDMTTEAQMTVTGYVGISSSGTLKVVTSKFQHEFEISSGAYTLDLPISATSMDVEAEVTTTVDSKTYTFKASGQFTGLKDGSIRNLSVVDSNDSEEEDADFEVEITDATFQGGNASVTFTIKNNTESAMTYFISAGSAWSLLEAKSVTVDGKSTATVTVTGYYDAEVVAPGNDNVTLIVTDINGSLTVTKDITQNSSSETGTDLTIKKSGDEDAANDKVSASQYMYALTFVNGDVSAKSVIINATGFSSSEWYATIMDSEGTHVGALGDTITVYGLQTVTYYVAFMKISSEEGDKVTAPSVTVNITGTVSQTLSLQPVDVSVETDTNSASGQGAINSRSGVPSAVWYLVALIIIMIIVIFWLASKRGVFARN